MEALLREKTVKKSEKRYLCAKRLFDLCGSLIAIVLLAIPLLLIALVIKIDSPGPAIFKQDRMGKNGQVFTIYKFRTMRLDAPHDVAARAFLDADNYITSIGAFLRRTSLDELPQLWNILIGDMSFVGYRPVCLTEVNLNRLRKESGVLTVRPGLTGYAQVQGRDNVGHRTKAELDEYYVRNMSVKMDLWCLMKTIAIVLNGEGVN